MKKIVSIIILVFSTGIMHTQNRPQPKAGKAPIVNIKKPQTFTLANGLKVMVVENHKLPKVTYNLTIDNPPFAEGAKKGVDELCSYIIGNGNTEISKSDFNEEVDFLGASVSFNSHGAYASSLSKYASRILELLSYGALHPVFSETEFNKQKAKLIEGLRSQEKSVPAIANRVVDVLTFGKEHPSGEYITEQTINAIALADVQENYNNYFVPENAYLVIIGDVKLDAVKPLVEKLFGDWKRKDTATKTYSAPENVAVTQINFIDAPNAAQSEISVVNTINLKMSDNDFFPAVLATYILGGGFNSYLNMNLREEHGWTYGANAIIGSGKYTTKMRSASSIKTAATDSAVVEFIKEIKKSRY
jgi:predicted Zn-dependent peptidase